MDPIGTVGVSVPGTSEEPVRPVSMGEAGEQLQDPVQPVPGITLYTTSQDRNYVSQTWNKNK
jgi:hypothetical protein